MIKKNCICVLVSAIIMLLFPWCAVTFIKGDGSMRNVAAHEIVSATDEWLQERTEDGDRAPYTA